MRSMETEIKQTGGCSNACQTIAGVLGNVLEWYDFALFGYFSDIIAKVFFPPQTGNTSLIQSFAIFGGAFLMRPVGGLLIGYIGDVYGRKRALTVSLFLMAFPTFAMGCLPSYERAGWWSVVLLVIARMLQGMSVGGQLPASLVYTVERHPHSQWGLYGSFVMLAANVGTLLGNVVGATTRDVLTEEQLLSWGWRVPFLSGIFISFVGLYLKFYGEEVHPNQKEEGEVVENPIRMALRPENRRALLSATMVPMLWGSGFYVSFVWMAIYMGELIDEPMEDAMWINSVAMLFGVTCMIPLSGHLSDKIGRKIVMTIGGCCVGLWGPVALVIISMGDPWKALFAQLSLGILLSLFVGPMMAWLVESFPPEVRLTSASLGYDLSHACVAGFSPLIATVLVDRVGVRSPAVMYPFFAIMSLIGLYISPDGNAMLDENGSRKAVSVEGADPPGGLFNYDNEDADRTNIRQPSRFSIDSVTPETVPGLIVGREMT